MDQGICQQVSKTANCVQKVSRRVKKLEKKVCDQLFLEVELATSITGLSNVNTPIIYDTVIEDSHNIYDLITGTVTLPNNSRKYLLSLSTIIQFQRSEENLAFLSTRITDGGAFNKITNAVSYENSFDTNKVQTLNFTKVFEPGVDSFPNSFSIASTIEASPGQIFFNIVGDFGILGEGRSFLQIQSL
jgi:hypothetical protein